MVEMHSETSCEGAASACAKGETQTYIHLALGQVEKGMRRGEEREQGINFLTPEISTSCRRA